MAQVYLLEKTRVVAPNEGERNYHVFYQMLKGSSAEQRSAYGLLGAYTDYGYMRGGIPDVQRVDDAKDWGETLTKMTLLGMSNDARDGALKAIAAVLAIGNIEFEAVAGSEAHAPTDPSWVAKVAALLGIEAAALQSKLTSRLVSAGRGSTYTVQLSAEQCIDSRDALSQGIYVNVFEWIVEQLNAHQRPDGGIPTGGGHDERFVGLLDIFGFENFKHNSFEQLCINFTNEKLQAHFMDALVKLRMLEYEKEGVSCASVDFPDNVAQLALIDGKNEGLFAALDDECKQPKGSELGYVDKLHALFAKGKPKDTPVYDKLKRAKGGLVGERTGREFPSHGKDLDPLNFVVVHYAEPVCYTADGWLDKNRGYLHPDLALILSNSSSALVQALFPPSSVDTSKKASVSATFRKSLRQLSATMLQTAQWYVRCIKPNGKREADNFEGHFVLRQLRYTGVASVVEIQRSGYPVSIAHKDFLGRYRCVALDDPKLLQAMAGCTPADACKALLRAGPKLAKLDGAVDWLKSATGVVGKTRVFMKDDVVRSLEAPRLEATAKAGLVMQRFARRMLARVLTRVLFMHLPRAAAVRAALSAKDAPSANAKLEELNTAWAAAKMPLRHHPLVSECKDELEELRGEVQSLEEGLEAEAEVLRELSAAIAKAADGSAPPKEVYVALKVALNAAKEASKGLMPELTKAITDAEARIDKCLVAMGIKSAADADAIPLDVSDRAKDPAAAAEDTAAVEAARQAKELAAMEAEVERQQAAKEAERRARQAEIEKELIAAAGKPEPSIRILKFALMNDYDVDGDPSKRLVGYTEKSTGVQFGAESNAVAVLRRGGQAVRDGLLKMGDVVLAVDGLPLNGERVAEALNRAKKSQYELTVARDLSSGDGGGRGDHAGWLHAVRAKEGKALLGQWVRKFWVVLDGNDITFRDSQRGRIIAERSVSLMGAECKTPVTQIRGQELKQPPVISGLLDKQRFPFTLHWPNGEVDHMVVLAASTSADRGGWKKALDKQLAELKKAAPISGWLMKQSGRKGNTGFGLVKVLSSGWKRRWFVLTQGDEGCDATCRYFKDYNACMANAPPLGQVVINSGAKLHVATSGESSKPNSLCVVSQGAADDKSVSTVLACANRAEMDKWMKSFTRAIKTSGGSVSAGKLLAAQEATQRRFEKISATMANTMALAELDTEELTGVKMKKLYEVASYLDVQLPPDLEPEATRKTKDKELIKINTRKLVAVIDSKRRAIAAERCALVLVAHVEGPPKRVALSSRNHPVLTTCIRSFGAHAALRAAGARSRRRRRWSMRGRARPRGTRTLGWPQPSAGSSRTRSRTPMAGRKRSEPTGQPARM